SSSPSIPGGNIQSLQSPELRIRRSDLYRCHVRPGDSDAECQSGNGCLSIPAGRSSIYAVCPPARVLAFPYSLPVSTGELSMRLDLSRLRGNSRLLATFALVAAFAIRQATAQQQGFSVRDDIAMVRFNDPSADVNARENDSDNYSPDGKHLAVVTTRGLLATDQLRSEIRVFDIAEIERFLGSTSGTPPKPRLVASITAISKGQQTIPYDAIIHDLRWNEEGTRIYFRGQNERGGYQLYEAWTNGRGCRPLTRAAFDVDHYDLAGETIAYTASRIDAPPPPPGVRINRDAFDATDVRSKDILFPGLLRPWAVKRFSMFTLRVGAHPIAPRPVPGYVVDDNSFFHHLFPFQLSPNGQWLISAEPIEGKI